MKAKHLISLLLLLALGLTISALADSEAVLGQWQAGPYGCSYCRGLLTPQYGSESHWLYCPRCDVKLGRYCHMAVCTNPTVCATCGAADVRMDTVVHGDFLPQHNETWHWEACEDCGLPRLTSRHLAVCTAPGLCTECGASDATGAQLIHGDAVYTIAFKTHQGTCLDCGALLPSERHSFDTSGLCFCGYKYGTVVRVPGDANEDRAVSIMDALLILQYDVGWNVRLNTANADVDADGAVTIMDALLVLQHDVGWDVVLR